ncbi:nicotinamide riboside transporter PnuC [uncultured Desulfuromusa sp.]|uniref:nicotinamide riboside transporter PnuC n=1 Tax=uncultured Desulfuromusa sp. TaxID=219183 RepID=UPI002AA6E35F|nr:nicotinamide riboside transporter PnuC [uncultured Desulfuromusa sp.]
MDNSLINGIFSGTIPWFQLLGTTPLEIIATLSAVIGVILIARQNILGWALGISWAVISAWLAFTQWQLVSDGILYLAYIPIQIYCWSVWIRRGKAQQHELFIPTWMPFKNQILISIAALLAIAVWAFSISGLAAKVSWIPEPTLLWRDSTTTVLNFFAQFLQARKRMENWVIWLIVNLLGIHIYWVKEAPIYSIQYAIFLGLGIYGWIQWHQSSRHNHQL